jgi:hypothetical protein
MALVFVLTSFLREDAKGKYWTGGALTESNSWHNPDNWADPTGVPTLSSIAELGPEYQRDELLVEVTESASAAKVAFKRTIVLPKLYIKSGGFLTTPVFEMTHDGYTGGGLTVVEENGFLNADHIILKSGRFESTVNVDGTATTNGIDAYVGTVSVAGQLTSSGTVQIGIDVPDEPEIIHFAENITHSGGKFNIGGSLRLGTGPLGCYGGGSARIVRHHSHR